jgi:hypothetical protein
MWDEAEEVCMQEEDLGGTGYGDKSLSDIDPNL